jgi:hypothetical protein
MSDYTVNDVVKAALEKDMIGLKAAVGDQLGSRAQEAIDSMYPEVGATMTGAEPSDPYADDYIPADPGEMGDVEEVDLEDVLSDEELEEIDSEEETDEDV